MKLNDRLKLARTQKGFTQQEVADLLHISRTTISSWEVGRTLPSLDLIIELSNLYNLSLDILLKEDMTMVNQVKKEVKSNKIYKRIVWVSGGIITIFLLINLFWILSLKSQYQYITDHWQVKEDSLIYSEEKISMMAPKLDFKRAITAHYLRKEPIWIISSLEKETESFLSLTFRDDSIWFDSSGISVEITVDQNINIKKPSDVLANYSYKEMEAIKLLLSENEKDIRYLYEITDKQYKLINN